MSANSDLILEFVNTWREKDIDKMLDYFTDDAVYINIPMEPINHGKEAIRAVMDQFTTMAEDIDIIVHHQGETPDGRVMNERTDRFLVGGKWVDLPVMGIFEFRDGKICGWRDYFDLNQFTSKITP